MRFTAALNILSKESFDDLARLAAHFCEMPVALIHFIKDKRHAVKSVVGSESQVELSDLPFFPHAVLQRDVFVVSDALDDERFSHHPLVTSGPRIRFYAGAPLISAEGEVVGTLSVMNPSPKGLTPYQIESLRMLAQQVVRRVDLWGDLVELKRSVHERRILEERLAAEHAVAHVLAHAETLSAALPDVLRVICESLGWKMGIFWQVNDQVNVLTCAEIWRAPSTSISESERMNRESILWPGEGLPGRVWTRGEVDWVCDMADEELFERASISVKEGLHGAFAFPIRGDHQVLGVMEFFSRNREEPDDSLLEMMTKVGRRIGQFIERKRAEESVIRSAAIVESSDDVIIGQTLDGIITSWNSGAQKLFGCSAEEMLGKPIWILFPSDRLGAFSDVLDKVKRGERVDRYETVHVGANGERVDLSVTLSPIRQSTGKLIGASSIMRVINDRKPAEEPFAESEARFRRVAESSILGFIFWGVDGNITDANDTFLRMVGYTREDLLSGRLRWRDMTPEEYRPLDDKALQDLITTGVCTPYEKEYFRKDGSRLSILIGEAFLESSKDRGLCVVLDITDRKKMEKMLRENEARREAILESSLDCIITIDHEGKILEFNPAAENTFGYRRFDVIGKNLAELIIPPSLRERHQAGLAHYLVSGESKVLYRRIEMTAMRADGSEFPIEVKVTRTFSDGPPVFTGYLRDISERKWTEQERHRLSFQERMARAEAEEARQHMGFLAEASTLLASSLDHETLLCSLARLAVPYLADGCVVDLLEEDQTVRRLAVAAADPAEEALGRELFRRYPSDLNDNHPLHRVLQTGKPIFLPEITDEMWVSIARDEDPLRMTRSLGLKSAIIVPLLAGERTLGALSFLLTDSSRRYRPTDLALAEDLARWVGVAVSNARPGRAARDRNEAPRGGEDQR